MTSVEPVPARFGRYRVLELLGRGGMGTVHRAFDTEHARMVALQRLSESAVDDEYRAEPSPGRRCRNAAGSRSWRSP